MAIKPTLVKKVNIYAPIPIRSTPTTIYGHLNNVSMSPAIILKCLIGRATVHEILPDGSLLKLNYKNYNTDNKPMVKAPQKVAKQESAIDPGETKMKRIVIDDRINLLDEINIVNVDIPEVKLEDAKPEDIVMESKPNMEPQDDEVVMVEYTEETIKEDTEVECTMTDEERELAELEAEIKKLEAEEAASKAKK